MEEEKFSVDIHRIMKGFPLEMNIITKSRGGSRCGSSYVVYIPVPDGYPNTPFKRYVKEKHLGRGGFTYLSISDHSLKKGDRSSIKHPEVGYRADLPAGCYLHISWFYVWSSDPDSGADEEEKKTLKGAGKLMLRTLFSYMIEKSLLKKQTNFVMLEASGGTCNIIPPSTELSEKNALWELYNIFPLDLISIIADKIKSEERNGPPLSISKYLCDIKDNEKLVKYYETYGLKRLSKYKNDNSVTMWADIRTFLRSLFPDRDLSELDFDNPPPEEKE
jgi:hypothetical protein